MRISSSYVVEKGKQPDKDGFVVQVSATDTDLTLLRSNVARRSSEIDTIPDAVAFEDSEGNAVVSVDQVQRNRVIYLAQPISGREVTYVPGSPVVGIALMIMDDMRGRYVDIFDKYDDTFSFHMFGTKGIITRDP
ncbi:hypothetical protein DL89DRAFT_324982 [Linderina pennispora]|uniref:Uncharacterized protein n=1 Tax=Linderina pennispora TaxID=61395 RepID=A0A1Y1VZA2_9FUNG|nr:uncharacterized protein DL89DRAFT_324982 [Linderina pennispora]ORX66583.1 hypothetical protein DL89DRAFT_324982 [Linderina pennispora]